MTRINQETGKLEFEGFVLCDKTNMKNFISGEWYRISDSGLIDNVGRVWGSTGNTKYITKLLTHRNPLTFINDYMSCYRVHFSDYSSQSYLNTSPKEDSLDTKRAEKIYNQFLSILQSLKLSNPFMAQYQLRDNTNWVCGSVINKIVRIMGYPESDSVLEMIYECITEEETFQDVRDKIEGDI